MFITNNLSFEPTLKDEAAMEGKLCKHTSNPSKRLISCSKSLNPPSKLIRIVSLSRKSITNTSLSSIGSTLLFVSEKNVAEKKVMKNREYVACKTNSLRKSVATESKILVERSMKVPKRPNVENMDILKQAFKMRNQSVVEDTISRSLQSGDEGIKRDPASVEWNVSSKDLSKSLYNSYVESSNAMKSNRECDIAPHKIVEYTVAGNREREKVCWENPVIGSSKHINLPSVVSTTKQKVLQKSFDKAYSSCSFTKEMLKAGNLIGPVDKKYIACLLVSDCYKMLVLVDQHAAHERIRLETFLEKVDFYSKAKAIKDIRTRITNLSPSAVITLFERELHQLIHYRKEFSNIGLRFSFAKSNNSHLHRVFILSVPSIFVNGCEPQLESKGSNINTEFLKEFLCEQMKQMQSTGSSCNVSSRAIFKALSSYACHGAIKFGDKISYSTCGRIMKDLSECDLPFQCAHGRPTIAPIFRLDLLNNALEKSCGKPDLSKLKKRNL